MGPLVPDIISNEFNYLIALILGVGFGFALEQAGFSSTRKLVGLFYGYDFTVLKVFFTAGITAMIGVLLLTHLGLLNVDLVFVNPMFVKSAIVGGLIMGAGFIIGGFCPGTSAAAAAVGKVDAMAFIGGSVLGIMAFSEGYPWLEGLYTASDMGPVLISDFFGISRIWFGILLTVVAIVAFIFTSKIQEKITGIPSEWTGRRAMKMGMYATLPLVVIALIALTPSRDELVMRQLEKHLASGECKPKMIEADKLAYEVVNNYYNYNIIDVRSAADYDSFHIATAVHIPLDKLAGLEYRSFLNQRIKINVFYGATPEQAKMACLFARFHGNANGLALIQSADEFRSTFYQLKPLVENPTKKEMTVYLFRQQSAEKMLEIDKSVANRMKPVEPKARKVQGGVAS
jgi:rhodanese-related sulfurtransferase